MNPHRDMFYWATAYLKRFDESFPIWCVPRYEEHVIKIIKYCLKRGKPYKARYNKNWDY